MPPETDGIGETFLSAIDSMWVRTASESSRRGGWPLNIQNATAPIPHASDAGPGVPGPPPPPAPATGSTRPVGHVVVAMRASDSEINEGGVSSG